MIPKPQLSSSDSVYDFRNFSMNCCRCKHKIQTKNNMNERHSYFDIYWYIPSKCYCETTIGSKLEYRHNFTCETIIELFSLTNGSGSFIPIIFMNYYERQMLDYPKPLCEQVLKTFSILDSQPTDRPTEYLGTNWSTQMIKHKKKHFHSWIWHIFFRFLLIIMCGGPF